jgi:sarcosine oxidase, subunit gamma
MVESALQPVADALAAGSSHSVELRELPLLAKINLRGDAADARFRDGVRRVIGVDPPAASNTFTRSGEFRCLWLGPDEWLAVGPAGTAQDLAQRLASALAGQHAAVVDVSASYATLQLSGARAREVLAKACTLDLHQRAFRAGQCAQTNVARTQGILALEDEQPVFRLFVRRSLAGYLAEWLLDAMGEYAHSEPPVSA